MAADVIYTGRGLSTKLPTDSGNAMQGLANFVAKAEETKFNVFQKNKDAFMKMTDVDPVMFLTTANQATQAKLLDDFNKEAAQIYKNSGGFPSMEEMQRIQAKKNFLISKQQEMQSDMERYLADREAISRDINGNLDKDEFTQREQGYFGGGRYGESPLSASPLDVGLYLNRDVNKAQGTPTPEYKTIKIGGVDQKVTISKSATEPEARDYIGRLMVSNPRIAKGIVKEIQQLKTTAPQEYVRIFDKTGDGTVDQYEEKEAGYVSNPIIKYAQDKYWQNAIKTDESKPSGLGSEDNTDVNISVFKGFGKDIKYRPTETRDAGTFGQTPYKTFHDLNVPVQDVNVKEIRVLNPDGESVRKNPGAITADLVGYDEEKDEFIFIATKDFYDLESYTGAKGKDLRFAVKRADLPEKYDEWEILKNGQKTKVGVKPRQAPAAVTQPTAPRKKVLKDGKWVYPDEVTQ